MQLLYMLMTMAKVTLEADGSNIAKVYGQCVIGICCYDSINDDGSNSVVPVGESVEGVDYVPVVVFSGIAKGIQPGFLNKD